MRRSRGLRRIHFGRRAAGAFRFRLDFANHSRSAWILSCQFDRRNSPIPLSFRRRCQAANQSGYNRSMRRRFHLPVLL